MFRPAALFIGLRYTRAKRRNHFISFISLMSMIGIALGVLVLITVLSVMNGFDREIQRQVFGMVPPVTVGSVDGRIADWQQTQALIKQTKNVTAVAPFVAGTVLLTANGMVQPVLVDGILPGAEKKINDLSKDMINGSVADLTPDAFNIILGQDLAQKLGVLPGDKITVVTPEASVSIAGVNPRLRRFTVSGIFHAGNGFDFDSKLAFMHLSIAQKLFQFGQSVSGLHVMIPNFYAAPQMTATLAQLLGPAAMVSNWTDTFGPFFHAVSMEKTMMFIILILIVAVAAFNLVCTLVMVVNEKQADIAILRTLGATPAMILRIFMVQGALIGVIGTLLGVVGGIALASHVGAVVDGLQRFFNVELLTSSAYFGLTRLPSELLWRDVWHISLVALSLSLLATLYPALRAARTEPAEALRYE